MSVTRLPALCLLLAGVLLPAPASAAQVTPFYSFDQNPFVQIFGLPALGDGRVLEPQANELGIVWSAANHFTANTAGPEDARLDGETRRTTLLARRGVGRRLEIGLELPFVEHDSGEFDQLVYQWHELFGLPHGQRDVAERNGFEIRYQRDGIDVVHLTEPTSGVGDVRITAGYRLASAGADSADVALRASLKLPTGDSAGLLGSGGTDLALWLSAGCGSLCPGAWGWFGGGGLLVTGQGEVLASQQRPLIGFGTVGGGYELAPWLTFKAQVDGHTDFFDQTELPQIGAASAQLVLGATLRFARSYAFEVAVSEELVHNTASDLVLTASLRARF